MLGSGELGVVALGVCLSLGCGGRDESGKMDSGTGGLAASAGQTGTQLVEVVLSSAGKLCEQLAKCYPDLQAPAPACNAPDSEGRKIQYLSPDIDPSYERLLIKCFSEYPDQAELAQWINCLVEVDRTNEECFSSCPADGEACVSAGSAARCETSTMQAQLTACYEQN